MSCMLRSDLMSLVDLYIQREAGFETLSQLGEMGCCQFLDLNADVQPFQKEYVADLCRCAEMARRLRYMRSEMMKDDIPVIPAPVEPRALQPSEMSSFENLLEKWEDDILEMSNNHVNLMKRFVELTEMSYVLDEIGPLLGNNEFFDDKSLYKSSRKSSRKDEIGVLGTQLTVITGVVNRISCFAFEMMLWRISRGNIYYRQANEDKIIKDPRTGKEIRKVGFLAICQGEELSSRMQKVCSGFRVNIYPCPKSYDERMATSATVGYQLLDLEKVLNKTHFHRCKALRVIARQLDAWTIQVRKAKAIYHHLNLFNLDISKNCLLGRCWVPERDLRRVQKVLESSTEIVGTNVPSFLSKSVAKSDPPTFHRTNKFTHGFQALINAYGDSTYRELNPGLYTIVTFPFLFGLMFSDFGHGMILVFFAMWMIAYEEKFMSQKSESEIWDIFFGGRYVILMMGIFSMYTGFCFNDMFSKSFNIFGSLWDNHYSQDDLKEFPFLDINPSLTKHLVYGYGLDPIWSLSTNSIMVTNSLKMKISIILGIVHMMFGLVLSLWDHIYFKQYSACILDFLPKFIFLLCIFFWLVFMMYFKWFVYTAKTNDLVLTPGCAPQILILFIDMVLMSETKPVDENCKAYMFGGQRTIQTTLVIIAVICVPILLFGIPLHRYRVNKRKQRVLQASNFRRYQEREDTEKMPVKVETAHVRYPTFGELMIHQGVKTIEYVLSTISHTASYLRLWALSLAHAELSHMLWHMVFTIGLRNYSTYGFVCFATFGVWAFFTLVILVVMEGLSAFLHTLRLHWVEFMSKFYGGKGWRFRPFSFKVILKEDMDKVEGVCSKKVRQQVDHHTFV